MAYQVLARKWRPQDFESVIGQEPIVTALRNALTDGRIAQAYLFSGIRGIGKTTAARVFAKALNCEKGPAADPCNECTICVEITAGSDLDVIEVDAATYSKVEQVRELTESLRYGPARDRYKVVVLDEIHRLSRQAFDALLKIIEEPPPHLVFIFATTEIDAVPATVLSRCQEFHFRRVPSEVVARHLKNLASYESIEVSEPALRLLARAGEGSVRDSVALLDQLATFGSGTIGDEDAARLLGGLDSALFEKLLGAILAGDHATVSGVVATVEEEGWDPRHVYAQFLAYCRDALHLALGTSPERIDLPGEEAERLGERARQAGFENLLRLLHQLLASESIVRRSDAAAIAAEIAWLRAAELPKLARVEELLGGPLPPMSVLPTRSRPAAKAATERSEPSKPTVAPAPDPTPPAAPEPPAALDPPEESPPEPPMEPPVEPMMDPTPEVEAADATPSAAPKSGPRPGNVSDLAIEVHKRKPPLAAHLRNARELALDGESKVLRITVPAGDDSLDHRLRKDANRRVLEEAMAEILGDGWSWRVEQGEPEPEPGTQSSSTSGAAPGSARPAPDDDPGRDVGPAEQAILEIFDGSVESVDREESA